ncbi:hypothetical protein FQN55_005542 [Onygenales sp. PD_40]|nr:hypothetical protein FQN55_005542 [Onygenales sp. PD_40]KAK2779922.1 hypothetical protein FQN52_002320 [Onygenales sp. PD_12]KAK2795302.1 hypothetical protein FQN51_000487 [Onygenales sp. PD_10]
MPPNPTAILYVLSSPGPTVSPSEFNAWYDDEHAPRRTALPGILSGVRYVSTDQQTPQWLAIYGLEDADILTSPAYTDLWPTASDREKAILPRLETLERRVYEVISERVGEGYAPEAVGWVVAVGLEPGPELAEEEFNRWYEEEHVPMVAECPGFLRVVRYRLREAKGENVARYLAVYEVRGRDFMGSEEFEKVMGTEWRMKIVKKVKKGNEEHRFFTVHKIFK